MAAKRKQGTLTQVERSVTSAARTAVKAADEYVIEPVSKALGFSSGKSKKRSGTKAKKRGGAKAKKRSGTKKRATRSTGARRSTARRAASRK